jgi:hypothetical protein
MKLLDFMRKNVSALTAQLARVQKLWLLAVSVATLRQESRRE